MCKMRPPQLCCALHAEGSYISEWTVGEGYRQRGSPWQAKFIITSIAATCTDGTELESVSIPAEAVNSSWAIEFLDEVNISSDANATQYRWNEAFDKPPRDLSAPNPAGGFRAVWLTE